MIGDSIPTPGFLLPLKEGFFDPYPLNGDGPIEPPPGVKVWVNPGFSRKQEAWENAQKWSKPNHNGDCPPHYVLCYLPVESSTRLGFDIAKKSPPRLTFDSRPYAGCRDIELIILEAGTATGASPQGAEG
jgi:hypothetical protein